MKKTRSTINGYGKLTGPAQDGIHTVDVTNDGKATPAQSEERHPRHRLRSPHAARPRSRRPHPDQYRNPEPERSFPKSLIIVGAGAVGVEFASIYRSFDSEVTIVEMLPRLVPVEDEEVSKELARVFRKRGINFHTSAKVDKVEKTQDGRRCHDHRRWQAAEDRSRENPDRRRPQAAHRRTSASKERRSSPIANSSRSIRWMQTAEPGVYAIGDIVLGTPQLAHVGAMEGIVAVARSPASPASRSIPSAFPARPIAIRKSAASA